MHSQFRGAQRVSFGGSGTTEMLYAGAALVIAAAIAYLALRRHARI
jgi:hypothetical protein